jgi:hypothetical protein
VIATILSAVTARPWILAVVAALAWGAVQKHRANAAGTRALTAEKALADIRADAAQLALQTAARTAAAHQEIARAAKVETERSRAAAVAASAAVGRLLERAAAAGGGAGAGSAVASGGGAASPESLVPAQLLRRVAEAAGELAEVADQRRAAGHACESAYRALSPTP